MLRPVRTVKGEGEWTQMQNTGWQRRSEQEAGFIGTGDGRQEKAGARQAVVRQAGGSGPVTGWQSGRQGFGNRQVVRQAGIRQQASGQASRGSVTGQWSGRQGFGNR